MEAGVCSCVMLEPSKCLDELRERGCRPDWFYDQRFGQLLQVLFGMFDEREPIELIAIVEKLRKLDLLDQLGGIPFISQLQDVAPSAANLSYYVDGVREKWLARQLLTATATIQEQVYEFTGTIDGLITQSSAALLRLEQEALADGNRRQEWKIRELMLERVIPKLESHYTRGRMQMSGLVTTGLEYLDKIFCGLGRDNGNYHVFAARPNVGKTSLITGFALHAALDFEFIEPVAPAGLVLASDGSPQAGPGESFFQSEGQWYRKKRGVPVAISSLEMSAESLGLKMLFQRAKADLQRWRTGFVEDEDFVPLHKATENICQVNNIIIDDTPRETIASIKSKWRRWHRQYGVRFFMLDYIQLIKSPSGKFRQDRVQEMEEISAELQALGKELNCPMAILAQLNRDYEKEPTRLPRLSDLKNCGAIEQDADSVTILYKPSLKKPGTNELSQEGEFFAECMEKKFGPEWRKWGARPERINALVEKNKHGPKGDAKLLFLKNSTLFVDYQGWLKQEGFVKPAAGEESRYRQGAPGGHQEDGGGTKIDPEDVPPRG